LYHKLGMEESHVFFYIFVTYIVILKCKYFLLLLYMYYAIGDPIIKKGKLGIPLH